LVVIHLYNNIGINLKLRYSKFGMCRQGLQFKHLIAFWREDSRTYNGRGLSPLISRSKLAGWLPVSRNKGGGEERGSEHSMKVT